MHFHKFEKIWLIFGSLSLALFLCIVGVTAFAHGHTPAGGMDIIDPDKVNELAPFNQPGVHQIDEHTYEAVIVSSAFAYNPNKIKIPAGKEIIFTLTSTDVIHSFTIKDTKVNMMAVPGRITHKSYSFSKPRDYLVICNESCGAGHHYMQMEIEVYEP